MYKNFDENQLTNWGNPYQLIETSYGLISRKDWQNFEMIRLGNCHLRSNEEGLTAIFRGNKEPKENSQVEDLKQRGFIQPVKRG